jgi:glycine cleavage system aminomethyltransferase T
MVQRHIAMARLTPEIAAVGNKVSYEIGIDHQLYYIDAEVTRMPFYNPPHKTA